jgi:lipopolysaccharide transport protein LptA
MMLLWMLYVTVVSLLLAGAAFAAERIASARHAPTRWHWVLSIVASAFVPMIIALAWVHGPRVPYLLGPAVSVQIDSLTLMSSSGLSPAAWVGNGTNSLSAVSRLDLPLAWAWVGASCALLLGLAISGAQLHRRKRGWECSTMAGVSVYLTDDVGPAIVGLLRPRIVVPRWLMQASAYTQELVVTHEQSHLQSHDVHIFAGALALLVLMPWNLPLWWQLRRLRFAIEVDCDARVLKSGRDARTYGETLITVGQRQSGHVGTLAGMSEHRAFLEKRLEVMLRKPARGWRLSAVALGCSSLALVATAAQIEPPNIVPSLVLRKEGMDQETRIRREIRFDASSTDINSETQVVHLTDVTITFGKITVKADQALANRAELKNSRWTFDGNVRISSEAQGSLYSDEAVIEFQAGQLTRATVTGTPVKFDQRRPHSGLVTRGHADEIEYEAGAGTLRLSNAYISDGKREINGPSIVYSLRK